MKILQKIPLLQLSSFFSKIFLDYVAENSVLRAFYCFPPRIESFGQAIVQKKFPIGKRHLLYRVLQKQYRKITLFDAEKQNLDGLLAENTFTVTTAHQPSVFLGELYLVYKAITAVRLAMTLQELYPDYRFVPVFWMGSEDHDFAEISRFRLFGKTYQWHTEQKGAVGRMKTAEISEILSTLPEQIPLFETAYTAFPTLSEATRFLLHSFFGKKGLLVIDGDDTELKKELIPIVQNELQEKPTERLVQETALELTRLGYHVQAQPRNINLFYLGENLRERIEQKADLYTVLHTDLCFTKSEILDLLCYSPEKFSPNALLRPIYQELILPNLAYVGGPSEIAYWLELKTTFEHFRTIVSWLSMPVLLPRNTALILTAKQAERIAKLQLSPQDFFQEEHMLKKQFFLKNVQSTFSLQQERETLEQLFDKIKQKTHNIDKSLLAMVSADRQKVSKIVEHLEKRIQKAYEKKYEVQLQQLLSLKEKLFPEGGLQERKDNFLNFYLNDSAFLDNLHSIFEPFSKEMYVLEAY